MTNDKSPQENIAESEKPVEREPYIPKPPSPEHVKQISQAQALITDEWTGEGPPTAADERSRDSSD